MRNIRDCSVVARVCRIYFTAIEGNAMGNMGDRMAMAVHLCMQCMQ